MADAKSNGSPTMNDVAKEARVSVATVSRVINGSGSVSEKLENRVKRAMKKLHYHPSILARSFKMQETRQIGLLIPLLDHPFFSRLTQATEQALFSQDYRAIICNTEENHMREQEYVELLLRQRVDGMIINSATNVVDYMADLQARNIPCVLIDRNVPEFSCSKVFSDNSRGGYIGMKYLLDLGHTNVVVVAPFSFGEPTQLRLQGIRKALTERGIQETPNMFIETDDYSFDLGVHIGQQIAVMNPRPTAVFALTDVTAVGILRAFLQANISVPRDISVMGYDGIPLASYVTPSISTVAQPIEEMGKEAVSSLLNHIQNPDLPPDLITLKTKLIIRESTAEPPH
ncbi:MAG: LacI family DNA-binding transcriptional regulator [Anaerolineae bacterium]|nr:LacI family DNA-binding transcriptional regulator [Anaerolineae bacterium]MCA9887608.1 LacI family DNA-binding transcriptional regulator [Anaerolineae bacterium]MCA9891667.1 LacI family DNA-binding transcriptional regulator [Anaerolineae bacterium]